MKEIGWLFFLFVVALFLLALIRPKKAFVLLFFCQPFMLTRVDEHYILSAASIIAIGVAHLLRLLLQGKVPIFFSAKWLPIYLFLGYMILQVLLSLVGDVGLRLSKLLLFYVFLPFFLHFVVTAAPLAPIKSALKALAVGGFLYFTLLLLVAYLAPETVLVMDRGMLRLEGFGGTHPAYVGSVVPFVVAGVIFASTVVLSGRGKRFVFVLIASLPVAIAAIATGSRAIVISTLLMLILFGIISKGMNIGKLVKVLGVGSAIAAIVVVNVNVHETPYFDRLQSVFDEKILLETRWLSFIAGFHMLKENYLFGIGVGNFSEESFAAFLAVADTLQHGYSARLIQSRDAALSGGGSIHFSYLFETGILGFVMYLMMLATATMSVWRAYKKSLVENNMALLLLLSAWIATLLHLTFVSGETHLLLWSMLGLMMCVSRNKEGNFPHCVGLKL